MGKIIQEDPQRTAQVALKTFFNIMKAWQIESYKQKTLLGTKGAHIYEQWQQGYAVSITDDVLIRTSYIIGIYRKLGLTFNDHLQANSWINEPNEHFDGLSTLEYILSDVDEGLNNVHTLIDII